VAKILSQDEIDALLNTVSAAEPAEEQAAAAEESLRSVIPYDFKHPNRVSKDQIRTLENLHDNFSGHLSSTLSAIQRAMVDVDLVSVDQITYSEFVMSLVSPSSTYTVTMEPLEGRCLIDFNPTLAFLFIDRLFGGVGKILDTERELTGIERAVLSKIAKNVFKELERVWSSIIKLEIKTVSLETNPQFVQIVAPGETVIVISMQIKMLGHSGLLTICYPYVTLEPVMEDLVGRAWVDEGKQEDLDKNRSLNVTNLERAAAEVSARLGGTEITVGDFLGLRPGDVIVLKQKVSDYLRIYVHDEMKFLARPGTVGNKKGFKVVGVAEDEE
jgi:flagellar motor switch protein FliM